MAVETDEESESTRRRFSPDVRVIERPSAFAESGGVATSAAPVAEPLIVPRQTEGETLHYIQIVDAKAGHRIVTCIEFLSLANKVSREGRDQYHAKQRKVLAGGVNLVEIDLLRAGSWVLAVSKGMFPQKYRGPYRISVVRGDRQGVAEVYPVSLREALPTIRIPLRRHDNDVPLQLQTLIDAAYANGRYGEDIDYTADPQPPLAAADAQWADQLLREKSLR